MKKTIYTALAAMAILAMGTACTGQQSKTETTATTTTETTTADKVETYSGVLPAADADGIRYTLKLDYTSDEGGTYDLEEAYLKGDQTSDDTTFKTKGDFIKSSLSDKSFIKLIPQSEGAGDPTLYFVIDSDSTITLTDSTLQAVSTPGMNYTLQLVK